MNRSLAIIAICLAQCWLPLSSQEIASATRPKESVVVHRVNVTHPGVPAEKARPYTLHQITDEQGYPTGYSMVVDSVICLHEECEIIKCTMVWDVLGRYQRYELPPGANLTKSPPTPLKDARGWRRESIPFSSEDHVKLNALLRDRYSVLKDHTMESISPAVDSSDVDAVTGATPLALEPSIVKGAAFTCYNLWHWAHGDVTGIAKDLTHQHCDEVLLRRLLASDRRHEVRFALDHLRQHSIFSPSITKRVKEVVSQEKAQHVIPALAYLEEAIADPVRFNATLNEMFAASKTDVRLQLLDYLKSREELPAALLETLSVHFSELSTYNEVHRLLALVEDQGAPTPKVLTSVSELLKSDDFFIARRAYWFLREQKLDETLSRRVKVFVDRHQDRIKALF